MNAIPCIENDLLTATLRRRDWLKATAGILLGARRLRPPPRSGKPWSIRI